MSFNSLQYKRNLLLLEQFVKIPTKRCTGILYAVNKDKILYIEFHCFDHCDHSCKLVYHLAIVFSASVYFN